jgi:hypothetical protein
LRHTNTYTHTHLSQALGARGTAETLTAANNNTGGGTGVGDGGGAGGVEGREEERTEGRKKEGLGLRLLQNADGVWRVEGLKLHSPAQRSNALFPGDEIQTIQGLHVTGQGWESLG